MTFVVVSKRETVVSSEIQSALGPRAMSYGAMVVLDDEHLRVRVEAQDLAAAHPKQDRSVARLDIQVEGGLAAQPETTVEAEPENWS